MASRPGFLRTLSSVSLIGALVLLLGIPLRAEEAPPMGEEATIAAREDPGMEFGQQSGVSEPHVPVLAPAPGPAITAAASAADTPTPSPVRALSAPGPATAPAVIQGVGIFNLSALL
jgi:hypothetical protein